MNGLVRFPIDLYGTTQDKDRVQKALSIIAQHGWDQGIKICCVNRDHDSLACMVTMKAITDFFLVGNLPVFNISPK